MWNIQTGDLVRSFDYACPFQEAPCSIRGLAVAPDGQLVLAGGGYVALGLWTTQTGDFHTLMYPDAFYYVDSAAFAPDGTRFAVGAQDGTIRVWGIPAE
jgi:WD40 repeat protein